MLIYENLIDKLIIFICCLIIYLCQIDLNNGVVPVLISIIFSGFLSYFVDEKFRTVLTIGFLFYPILCLP
jgi:hypothetical protein